MPKLTAVLTALFFLTATAVYAADSAKSAGPAIKAKKEKKVAVKSTPDDWKKLVISAEDLAKFNGKNGNPSYVAVDGVIYDVSAVAPWKGGAHMGRHQAGIDLTNAFNNDAPAFHRTKKVLSKCPKIGVLKGGPLDPANQPAKPKEVK